MDRVREGAKVVVRLELSEQPDEVWEVNCRLQTPTTHDLAATGGDTDLVASGTLMMMTQAVSVPRQTAQVVCEDHAANAVIGDAHWENL